MKGIENILLHSQPIPHFQEMSSTMSKTKPLSENHTLIVSKTLRTYLEHPFGNCSYYYPKTVRPFNASSYMQCYRLCIRDFAEKLFNCVPLFIDDSISEFDFPTNDKTLCPFEKFVALNNITKNQLFSKCNNYCPKDCLTVDYSSVVKRTDSQIGITSFGII